ncbi:GntR family transcriptional regulator [Siminovitchia terrae]|uniref:FadR family transcriptional regulator n=1 Tax=Siminovitchia terrae TaxID=1914933 RepID=A0A429X1S5_SIMTE|nr:FadR family transcriptional regulator [Siminovitchia terrae]GIN89444.1 GntR family transcriptional regulator [Siminovitchia terrae]GIN98144.1 GntR family transcriptional regulator [Siminovitchia terrae]
MNGGSSLFNSVIVDIEKKINDGDLKEGDKLPSERELTRTYEISRHGVRQALTVLKEKGLIKITPGKGAFITSYNEDILTESFKRVAQKYDSTIEEILEVREELELSVISKAVLKATPKDIDTLIEICKEMDQVIDVSGFLECDLKFHKALADASQNCIFAALVHSFFEMTEESPFSLTKYTSNFLDIISKAQKQHWVMIEALKTRDQDLAMKTMTEHMELFREEVDFLRSKNINFKEVR